MNNKITVPGDRTLKQPTKAFCRNPECSTGKRFEFEFEHDNPECPKCGASREPMIGMIVLTHLLIRNKNGVIEGDGGLRYQLACDLPRAYLATVTNLEAATNNRDLYNCKGCAAFVKQNLNNASRAEETTTNKILEGISNE